MAAAWHRKEGCLLRTACTGLGDTAPAQHEELARDRKPLWDPKNEGHT